MKCEDLGILRWRLGRAAPEAVERLKKAITKHKASCGRCRPCQELEDLIRLRAQLRTQRRMTYGVHAYTLMTQIDACSERIHKHRARCKHCRT